MFRPTVRKSLALPVRAINGVDDSKRLAISDRERLAVRIRQKALAVALGAASAREVDRLNIYHATVLAGANIGENAMLGAFGLATKPVPPGTVAVGIPAHVKRQKDSSPPPKP